jgi:hypothetical protein
MVESESFNGQRMSDLKKANAKAGTARKRLATDAATGRFMSKAEPVAWMVYTEDGKSVYVTDNPTDINPSQRALPLFTTPQQAEPVVDGNTSDGYHTFNELYDFRMSYNAALFNEWAESGKHFVHKSRRHHDGELCFGGGYFVVVAVLPEGQISNHYKAKYWNLFNVVSVEKALFEFDGHTGTDVLSRLKSYRPQQAEPVAVQAEPVPPWYRQFCNCLKCSEAPKQAEPVSNWPDVDQLAQQIRRINGDNKMGAASLAEALLEWLRARVQAEPVAEPYRRATDADNDQSMTQADDDGNASY